MPDTATADVEVDAAPRRATPVPSASSAAATAAAAARWFPREPLLATKLSLPAVERLALVRRPRLTARIGGYAAAAGSEGGDADPHPAPTAAHPRLTLIVAPAGFGKTTLVSEWCAALRAREADGRPVPVAYVSLDAGDNDPTRFLTYLIAALQGFAPGLGDSALALLRSPQPTPREAILTVLLNDLAALETASPVTVVLDDYHLLSERAVHEAVTFLLEHLPPTVHFVIASRADPPLPLSRLRARGQMAELRAADLRCSGEEAGAFLNEVMRLGLSAESVAALENRTEGWMAGLQLAALSLQNRQDREDFITAFTGSHRYIVDYLGEEVLLQQPEEVQTFLLKTSLLDRFCAPLCDAVAERTDSDAILERLERANLFLIPLDDERRWWRYHHLFADMLRALRMRRETPGEHHGLHQRAAQWFTEQGYWAEAVEHALAGHQFAQAARIIADDAGEAVWRRGESATLTRWLDRLPEEVWRAEPRLCLLRLRPLLIAVRIDEIAALVEDAERGLRASGTPEDDRIWGEVFAVRAFVARFRDDLDGALRLCAEAMKRLPAGEATLWRAVVALLRSNIQASRGDLVGALEGFREAAAGGEAVGDVQTTCVSLFSCGLLSEELGRLRQAEGFYEHSLAFLREVTRASDDHLPPIAAYAQVGLASLAFERNDLEAAERLLDRARPAARLIEGVQAIYRSTDILLDLYLLSGREQRARELLREWEVLVQSRPLTPLLRATETLWARLALECGDLNAVEEWAAQQGSQLDASLTADFRPGDAAAESFLKREVDLIVLARLHRLQNRPDDALRVLRAIRARSTTMRRESLVVRCLAHEAAVLAARGDADGAQAALTEALCLGEPEGFVRTFLAAGSELSPILRRVAAAPPEALSPRYLTQLCEAFAAEAPGDGAAAAPASPRPAPGAPHPAPDALSEREIEVLRLVADGLSNPEVADRLFLSVGTVKRHVHNIFGKLNAANRVEAIARAREMGAL